MSQPTLFSRHSPALIAGATYEPEHDEARLTSQLERVRQLMSDGRWRTLAHIAQLVHGSEAGVSARIRDLRKIQHGGYVIERQRHGDPRKGIWLYRMAPAEE